MKISGGCACGSIRYEGDADPAVMVNCHCRDCQRSTGSGYAPVMALPAAAIKFKGTPRYYKTIGESGKAIERGFCVNCGSPVAVKLERFPDLIGVQAASLDDPSQYKPGLELFTESAQAWDLLRAETQKKPRGFSS